MPNPNRYVTTVRNYFSIRLRLNDKKNKLSPESAEHMGYPDAAANAHEAQQN